MRDEKPQDESTTPRAGDSASASIERPLEATVEDRRVAELISAGAEAPELAEAVEAQEAADAADTLEQLPSPKRPRSSARWISRRRPRRSRT